MNRQQVLKYVREQYGTEPDFPFASSPDSAALRHAGSRRWYGLMMSVHRARLGLSGEGHVDVLNVKCEPALHYLYRQQPGILPAYHMNKEHWLSVLLDGSAPDARVRELIDLSFSLTQRK